MSQQSPLSIKIVLTGEPWVGKTSLLEREVDNQFTTEKFSTTLTDFRFKKYRINDVEINAQIWDGISIVFERLELTRKRYYGDAHVIGLCFSLHSKQSLFYLQKRIPLIYDTKKKDANVYFIGCKSDWEQDNIDEAISELIIKYRLKFFKTSAKQNIGVNQAFQQMIRQSLPPHLFQEKQRTKQSILKASENRSCQIM